jgi:hypothetical protein
MIDKLHRVAILHHKLQVTHAHIKKSELGAAASIGLDDFCVMQALFVFRSGPGWFACKSTSVAVVSRSRQGL